MFVITVIRYNREKKLQQNVTKYSPYLTNLNFLF